MFAMDHLGRNFRIFRLFIMLSLVFLIIYILAHVHKIATKSDSLPVVTKFWPQDGATIDHVSTMLRHHADKNGVVLISYVDYGYIDMAMNFYVTSLARFQIENYVMISADERSCDILNQTRIHCVYADSHMDALSDKASTYGTHAFTSKTHAKSHVVLNALKVARVNVLFVDLDIVFIRNPIPLLWKIVQQQKLDFVIQRNHVYGEPNTGFYLARPTSKTIRLFSEVVRREQNSLETEQPIFKSVLEFTQKTSGIQMQFLDPYMYQSGAIYWENKQSTFEFIDPWRHLAEGRKVIVHNNWIVTKAAKIFRFKESLLWRYDQNAYYTDTARKYMTYSNAYTGSDNTASLEGLEKDALLDALSIAYLLNRTLILPAFNCAGCEHNACIKTVDGCSLQAYYKIEEFDKHFYNAYREHTFLDNPLTPEKIKQSKTNPMLIQSAFLKNAISSQTWAVESETISSFHPKRQELGASVSEILEWFAVFNESILDFHSLYGAFEGFPDEQRYFEIKSKLEAVLVRTAYNQLE